MPDRKLHSPLPMHPWIVSYFTYNSIGCLRRVGRFGRKPVPSVCSCPVSHGGEHALLVAELEVFFFERLQVDQKLHDKGFRQDAGQLTRWQHARNGTVSHGADQLPPGEERVKYEEHLLPSGESWFLLGGKTKVIRTTESGS